MLNMKKGRKSESPPFAQESPRFQRADDSNDKASVHLHKVSLEEAGQLPLGRRISEVSDIESATLCSAGQNCIALSSVGGLISSSIRRFVGD